MARKPNSEFWNKEYKHGHHLTLSEEPSEDFIKFTRFLSRQYGGKFLNNHASALDLGCGNGRNLIYLAENFGMKGTGLDNSAEAIAQAKKLSEGLPIEYQIRSIGGNLPIENASQTLVLDMMTSHFLNDEKRQELRSEILRALRPDGWLFWKTFLLDGDLHAKRLLEEHPGKEKGSYIHPKIGVAERVFTEEEIIESLGEKFTIHKITKSHRHHERAGGKRRSISIYAQKNWVNI